MYTYEEKNPASHSGGSLWFYAEEVHRLIELHSYYMAEKDGFRKPPVEYWLEAENQVCVMVKQSATQSSISL